MKPDQSFFQASLWIVVVVVIVAVIATGMLTNFTLRSIEKSLPNTLLSELNDLSYVLEDIADVVSAAELAKISPHTDNFNQLRFKVKTVYDDVVKLRHTYVFDNMVRASAFHAVVAPAIADLQIWLSEGVSGYGPETEMTANIVLSRISKSFTKARALSYESRITAQNILDEQLTRLDQFLISVNVLFLLTLLITTIMIFFLIRQYVLQRREAIAQIERRRVEQSLQESERRFQEIAENINEVFWLFDWKEKKVIYASPAYEKIWGRPIENLYKRYDEWAESIHPDDRDFARQSFEDIVTSGAGVPREYRIVRPDGTVRWISDRGVPIFNEDKEVFRITGTAEDVTERKKAEALLQESQEKIARSKKMESLGLLAGGVAHDLNNILSGIVSYPELLLMDLPDDSKLKKPIKTMQESGHRAAAIVQDLLTVARGVATIKEPLSLNDLIREYLNSPEFKKLKQFHPSVMVETSFDTELFNINGSQVHIKKVVMNLVSNASEAIDGSGNVTISTMNRYLDRPLRGYDDVKIGEYVVLSVSDDGSGISSEDIERIFEPFYTKKVMGRSGTGLGLAVVWNVVQDHKGYINVKSDKNVTTFDLYFPITRKEISRKELSKPIELYKGAGETILIVDDMATQREISCSMLRMLGYDATSVSSGDAAIEYLEKHAVDLMLIDMIMDPGIDGLETYKRVLELYPQQKAIIASGFSETDRVKEAQRLGVGQYIKKPYTLEKIGLAVRSELKKSKH